MDNAQFLARAFGTETRVRQFQESVEAAGRSVGIEFRFDLARFTPNARPAHRTIRRFDGSTAVLEAADRLFSAYFCDGVNIGDEAAVGRIMQDMGPGDATRSRCSDDDNNLALHELDTGRIGINGVPSFVFSGRNIISGAHDQAIMLHLIDVSARFSELGGSMPAPAAAPRAGAQP